MAILLSFIIFFNCFSCYFGQFESLQICFASEVFYARILTNDAHLYLAPIQADDYSNQLFTLPKTYFVQLLDNAGTDFFKVKYKDFFGYVKKDKVQTVVGTPQTPYLEDINFRVYAELSRDMRTQPCTTGGSADQLIYLPNLNRNLTYYGPIVGENLIEGRTSIWYYCKYSADKDYYGYVYSDFCDELPATMPINTEELEFTTAPDFKQDDQDLNALPMENKTTAIVIAVLSVPACLFVYLVLRSSKISSDKRTKQKEIIDY